MMNTKKIVTERLTIRAVEPDDWKAVRQIWEDVKKTEYHIYDTPKNTEPDDVRRRIARWQMRAKTAMSISFSQYVSSAR